MGNFKRGFDAGPLSIDEFQEISIEDFYELFDGPRFSCGLLPLRECLQNDNHSRVFDLE
jgi:hypothetical protein